MAVVSQQATPQYSVVSRMFLLCSMCFTGNKEMRTDKSSSPDKASSSQLAQVADLKRNFRTYPWHIPSKDTNDLVWYPKPSDWTDQAPKSLFMGISPVPLDIAYLYVSPPRSNSYVIKSPKIKQVSEQVSCNSPKFHTPLPNPYFYTDNKELRVAVEVFPSAFCRAFSKSFLAVPVPAIGKTKN